MSLPYTLANGTGNPPDADKFMANYHYLEALAGGNQVPNGGFEDWNNGPDFAAPVDGEEIMDGWILRKSGTSLATAAINRESTIIDEGVYSGKINISGAGHADSLLALDYEIPNRDKFRAYTVILGMRVYASTASKVRVKLNDGVNSPAYSSYHTGGGSWETLTQVLTVSGSLIQLTMSLEIVSDFTGAIYADGAFCYVIPSGMSTAAKAALRYSPFI